MRQFRFVFLLAAVAAASLLSSCGDSGEKPFTVRTYNLGERITLGHIVYVVFETQWLTHIGEGTDARIPQHRFFLVRLSALNSLSTEIVVPNFSIEDDSAAEAARLRRVALLEGCENHRLLARRNAATGIGDHEVQWSRFPSAGLAPYPNLHPSRGGELNRVAHQVDQNLPQARVVSAHPFRYGGIHLAHQCQPFLAGSERWH